MGKFNIGDSAAHEEFGTVRIFQVIDSSVDDPVVRDLLKMLGGDQTYYRCQWQRADDPAPSYGIIPECQLTAPAEDKCDLTGYERNESEESALVDEIIGDFNFSSVVKTAKILAIVDPEEFDYYEDIPHFKDAGALRDIAEKEMRSAFDNLHKYARADTLIGANDYEPYWMYQCSGVFDVTVYYTPGQGYDASLKFVMTEASTL